MAMPLLATVMAGLAVACLVLGLSAWRVERDLRRASLPLEDLGLSIALSASLGDPPRPLDAQNRHELQESLLRIGAPRESVASITGLLASDAAGDRAIGRRTLAEVVGDLETAARRRSMDMLGPLMQRGDLRPTMAYVGQARALVARLAPDEGRRTLIAALDQLATLPERAWRQPALRRAEAELLEALAAGGDDASASPAFNAWRALAADDPCSLALQLRLATAAERIGAFDVAHGALSRALEIDEALKLDPRRRLTSAQREDVVRRRAAVEQRDGGET